MTFCLTSYRLSPKIVFYSLYSALSFHGCLCAIWSVVTICTCFLSPIAIIPVPYGLNVAVSMFLLPACPASTSRSIRVRGNHVLIVIVIILKSHIIYWGTGYLYAHCRLLGCTLTLCYCLLVFRTAN